MPSVTSSNVITSTAQIGDGVIVNADINNAAAIAKTKLAALHIVDADVDAHTTSKITTPLSLLANAGGAAGNLAYWDGSNWVKLAIGAGGTLLGANAGATAPAFIASAGNAGQVLTSNGAGAVPSFQAVAAAPAWIDEGTLTWAAATDDKTLTFTNSGKDVYMIIVHLVRSSTEIDMQINADATAHYNYLQDDGDATWSWTAGASSWKLYESNSTPVNGVLYLTGSSTGVGPLMAAEMFATGGKFRNGYHDTTTLGALASIKIIVNGGTITGKVHAYSLNL